LTLARDPKWDTGKVKDISPGSGWSSPGDLAAVGDTLYFRASDGATGYELWKSDGTQAGTVQVIDLSPGSPAGLDRIFKW
jgi:ELWxxDGT repeat protein